MPRRLGTVAIGLPLLYLIVWVGGIWFTLAVAAAAAVAALELAYISSARGGRAGAAVAVLATVAVVIYAHFVPVTGGIAPVLAWLSTAAAIASMTWLLLAAPSGGRARSAVFTAAIVGLVGGTLLHAPMLREVDMGREWVLYLLAVTFASDTSAYLVGRSVGRLELAPGISPGKTWEGAAGGLAGGIAASVAAITLLSLDVSMVAAIGAGAALSIVGQLGDLGESKLKRLAGAKDSGVAVPGHGGIMDRLDSIVWNLVVVYHFVS
jgi:phosphatidate cytidylyltransferase